MKVKPALWEQTRGSLPGRLFVTVIELKEPGNLGRDCQPLALLTRTRLPNFPPFPLHLQIGKTSDVICHSLLNDTEISPSRLSDLTDFTLRIYKDIYNKLFEKNESEMTYWLAPVINDWKGNVDRPAPHRLLDWEMISYVCNNSEIPWSPETPHNQLLNRYLIDKWDGGRRFFSVAMEPTMKPRDPVPKDAASHKYMNTILDYTVSLFSKSRNRAKWREEQPVIRAEKVLHRLNLLDEHTDKEKSVKTRSYLCPEPLRFSAVSAIIIQKAEC